MPTADTPLRISEYSQERIARYVADALNCQLKDSNFRATLEMQDRQYQREMDWTKETLALRQQMRMGQATKMLNITVPVVMPQVETAHSYLVETFLSSYPIFPVVSGPEYSKIAEQVDAVMAEAAVRFQYGQQLSLCFRDALKHNLLAIEVDWKTLKTYSVATKTSVDLRFGVPVETEYAGNKLKWINLYNLIVDPRVRPSEVHSLGDYAGYTERMSYIRLKNLFLELDTMFTMNADEAFKSSSSTASDGGAVDISATYMPQINPDALRNTTYGTNWLTWAGLQDSGGKEYQLGKEYEVTTLYMRVIPRALGINVGKERGLNGVPQIFKVIVVNGKVTIYVEHKSNAHNFLPIVVGQYTEDGLDYQTKSFVDNAMPFQQLSSALYNSAIASQRRKVFDRLFYDPNIYDKAAMDRVDPVARIPMKQNAYGKPASEGVFQLPYRDEGVSAILAIARDVSDMSDVALGQNKVQRGQFQKGNKTLREFETVMDKSDLRVRSAAVLLEISWLQPIKHIMKMNILQYQPPAELYNMTTQRAVQISPEQLRSVAWQFQIADGILPVSKLLNPELFEKLLQYGAATTQLGQPMPYDLVSMGVYSLKLQGASWVDAFKLQPRQQVAANGQQQPPQQGPQ